MAENDEAAPEPQDPPAGDEFARHDEPTTKMPSLKKMGLLKRDAERHRDLAEGEEEVSGDDNRSNRSPSSSPGRKAAGRAGSPSPGPLSPS